MPNFGSASRRRRETLDPRLQEIADDAIKIFDFTIVCGHRNQEDQEKAFNEGKSKLHWPDSKHNSSPSKAVDLAPYDPELKQIDWNNRDRFIMLAGIIMGVAQQKNIRIRWGGDWDSDTFMRDHSFQDLPHFELAE
jgi:hypothetical protein